MSSIGLRQHTFNIGPFTFAHNFLVQYDDQGNVIAELHGLATDPATGKVLPIGRSSEYLRAFELPGKNYWSEGQSEKILWEGPGTAERWRAAKEAHDRINNRNLTYNGTGGDLNGPRDWDAPAPPVIAGNSNSANRAFIDAMGLRLPSMPTMAPGTENQLLEQKLIDQIQQNNGIPPRPRGGLF